MASSDRDPQGHRWPGSLGTSFFHLWNLIGLSLTCHLIAWHTDVLRRMAFRISARYDAVFGKELLSD